MFHWENIPVQEQFGMNVKMYRPIYQADETQTVANENLELDHVAHKYLDDSQYMYKVLDLNFVDLMENRFDVSKLKTLKIPTKDTLE